MDWKGLYKTIADEKSRAHKFANEIMKEADRREISIPALISALAYSYRTEGEIEVEKEMMREEMNNGYLY